MKTSYLEPHNEFYLRLYKEGVQIIPPLFKSHPATSSKLIMLQELMDLKLSVYFLDTHGICKNINYTGALINTYISIKDALGRSAKDVLNKSSFNDLREKNLLILNSQETKIFENHFTFVSNQDCICIDYKFPWYDCYGNLQGIFGIALATGDTAIYSLKESIDAISKINFLLYNSKKNAFHPLDMERLICGVYLSQQEYQCVRYMIRGMTAKMIGQAMGLSFRTVEHYINNIKTKFSVGNKKELINKIIDNLLNDVGSTL